MASLIGFLVIAIILIPHVCHLEHDPAQQGPADADPRSQGP